MCVWVWYELNRGACTSTIWKKKKNPLPACPWVMDEPCYFPIPKEGKGQGGAPNRSCALKVGWGELSSHNRFDASSRKPFSSGWPSCSSTKMVHMLRPSATSNLAKISQLPQTSFTNLNASYPSLSDGCIHLEIGFISIIKMRIHSFERWRSSWLLGQGAPGSWCVGVLAPVYVDVDVG